MSYGLEALREAPERRLRHPTVVSSGLPKATFGCGLEGVAGRSPSRRSSAPKGPEQRACRTRGEFRHTCRPKARRVARRRCIVPPSAAMLSALARTYRQAYSGLPRAAWLQALVELVNRTGMMVLFFMTLYATSVLGLSVVQAGRIMSAYGLGALVGAWLGGYLSDRIGSYHVQKLSLALSSVVLVALTLPRSAGPLAGLMFLLAVAA